MAGALADNLIRPCDPRGDRVAWVRALGSAKSSSTWRAIQGQDAMSAEAELTRAQRDARDSEHVRGALAKEPGAVATLIQQMAPVVHVRVARALRRRRGQARGRDLRADLEDMVQEVFTALFAQDGRALRAWSPERGLTFDNFVGLLAEREVSSIMRSGKRNPWTEDPTMDSVLIGLDTSGDSPEAQVLSRQMLGLLAQRLQERLSPLGYHYFQLLFVQERSVAEVVAETGTTPDALYAWRSRLRRLIGELAEELGRNEGGKSHG